MRMGALADALSGKRDNENGRGGWEKLLRPDEDNHIKVLPTAMKHSTGVREKRANS